MRLPIDLERRLLDARRVTHSARRRGHTTAGVPLRLDVSRLQEFVDSVPDLRAADATVMDVRGEGRETRLVRHGAQARLDVEDQAGCDALLDRGGQPFPGLSALSAQVDWKTGFEPSRGMETKRG